MGLEFINVYTNERRNISDLNAALELVKDPGRSWSIKNPAVDSGSPAWEIVLSSAPMAGTYPRMYFDTGNFTPDNLNFYDQATGQMLTLRNLLAAANTAPPAPPIVDPFEDVVYPVYEQPPPPAPFNPLMDIPPEVVPLPYVPPITTTQGPALLRPEDVPPVLYTVNPIFWSGPAMPWEVVPGSGVSVPVDLGPGLPYNLPFGPVDVVNPPAGLPGGSLPVSPMFPASKWTVTIDGPGGEIIQTRAFPVRVVVDGKGRLVYSEVELSDALSNGGHIAGPDDNEKLTDYIRLPPDVIDDFPNLPRPKRIDYAAPAGGFPWWLLLVGAGLVLSKKKG